MPTFTEVLPERQTGPAAIDWTPGEYPGTGTLVIKQKRAQCEYVLTEIPTDWEGRAVRFVKPAGSPGTDKEAEGYDVFVHRGGQDCRCCCRGFERWGHCKHIDAVKALLSNGWLDLDPVNPDQDTGPTEVDDQPESTPPPAPAARQLTTCGYCRGTGLVPSRQHDSHGRFRPDWAAEVWCGYCGGEGKAFGGDKLSPAAPPAVPTF